MNSNGTPSPSMALRLRSPATTPSASGGRDDCWSEDATFTLIEAWGDRYLECNRGNLRQKHWQEVADTVNDRHHKNQPTRRRTDIQCKNRIDTLKKKYKVEKARFNDSGGYYVSPWPFFSSLDALIGTTFPAAKKPSPSPSPPRLLTFSTPVPVARRSATVKRPAPVSMWLPETASGSPYHRKFSAFAAAAAAAAEAEEAAAASRESEEERVSSEGSGGSSYRSTRSDKKRKRRGSGDGGPGGFRELAEAVERFAEIYERVEGAKQKQMIELEKQRMQFAKDLEFQRMQFIMETQIQLQKLKRANDSSANGNY